MTLEKPVLFERDTEVPPEKGYILIHPRSTQKERSISLTALDVLIRSLLERQERSIVIPGWGEDGRTLEESFRGRPKVIIKKDLPLRMTVRYIKHASLCIAVESFLLHIADAVDRNFIGVFGPSDPRAALVHQSKAVRLPTKDLSSVDGAILTDVEAGRLQENGW
jgi:ADP-heptose:LPS heptosyltransferase